LSLVKVSPPNIQVLPSVITVPLALVRMPPSTIRVPLNGSAECERLSLRKVLIVEDVDLDIWIFTPAPWWA
jgi:hypothetical protein